MRPDRHNQRPPPEPHGGLVLLPAPNDPVSRYLQWMVVTLATGACATILFNAAVDPYGLLSTPTLKGWTAPKTETHHRFRLVRAYEICSFAPVAIALGASDAALGIDPSHRGWKDRPVRNVALLGGNIHELRRYFEHAHARHPLKQVVLDLDLSFFDASFREPADFDENRLGAPGSKPSPCARTLEPWTILPSIDVLYSSVATLFKNFGDRPTWVEEAGGELYQRHEGENLQNRGGAAPVFRLTIRGALRNDLLRPSYKLEDANLYGSLFDELQAMAATALRDGVDLRIYISPVHAYLLETRRFLGLDAEYERWLRSVLETVADESAKHPGTPSIPIWDFSGYNSVTTETVPPEGDLAPMRWYHDPSHYKREAGDLILDRVLGVDEPAHSIPAGFGVPVTPESVDRVLARRREAGDRYRETHASEVAALEAMAREVLEFRRRRGIP